MQSLSRVLLGASVFALGCGLTGMSPGLNTGVASWYSRHDPGVRRLTASGELFDDSKLTCASWHFKFGSYVRVTNRENGRSVVCKVNDRGPDRRLNRIIDLSKASFRSIASLKKGLIPVKITPHKTKSK